MIPVKDTVYPKDLKLQKPQFVIFTSGKTVSITSNVAVKYLYLTTKDEGISFSDNYFDLKPGETKMVTTNKNINLPDLKIKSLYDILKTP